MFRVSILIAWMIAAPAARGACEPPQARYGGPLFDAMAQIDAGMDALVLRSLKDSGVSRMALFGRDKPRRSGGATVASLSLRQPGVFVVGAPKRFDQRGDLSGDYIRATVAGMRSREYGFVGEILFAHADKARGEQTADGERYADPNNPGTRRLLDELKGLGVPLMAHWEVYDWRRDWPSFQRIYAQYPEQLFIWPHAGFGSAAQVEQVLSAHSNVTITLSKKEEPIASLSDREKLEQLGEALADECGTLVPEWRALIVKYSDRVLFATDAHKEARWQNYARIVERWRLLLAQLPPDVAAKVAYANAERIYGAAAKPAR